MIVLFDKNNREYLRIYREATDEEKQKGIEVNEEEIPTKNGFSTVIYNNNGKAEFKFEEIQKTDEDKQKEAIDLLGKQVAMLRIQLMRGGVK